MRNFSPAFIDGSTNIRISNVKNHATTYMHTRAMHLLRNSSHHVLFEVLSHGAPTFFLNDNLNSFCTMVET